MIVFSAITLFDAYDEERFSMIHVCNCHCNKHPHRTWPSSKVSKVYPFQIAVLYSTVIHVSFFFPRYTFSTTLPSLSRMREPKDVGHSLS